MATYSGGAGTSASPYQIKTKEDLNTLAATSEDWTKYFILMKDVAFTAASTKTIGTEAIKFTGTYDGNKKSISNFTIDKSGSDNIGLFGYLGSNGEITNLTVNAGDAGVSGLNNVGILVGYNFGTITDCSATGTATATNNNAGGLVGYNAGTGTITNCFATGTAAAADYAGGLVGWNYQGIITNCYATGSANATNQKAGGLVGYNILGTITESYATGNATATKGAGGLVGVNTSAVTNCYRVQSTGSSHGTVITDLSKFKDIDWLTGTTTNNGLKWSADIISTEKDDTKIWYVKSNKSIYPIFQWQVDKTRIDPGVSFGSANMMMV